jgi:hypothetical protein
MLNQIIGLLFEVIDFHYQTSIKLKLQTHGSDFILLYVLATFFLLLPMMSTLVEAHIVAVHWIAFLGHQFNLMKLMIS